MIKEVHNSLAVHRNSWTLNVVIKTSLVITLTPSTPNPQTPTSLSRIAYENRYMIHPLSIFNSYLFNRTKIVPIYAHESSKPTFFIKRRIEHLTKAHLAGFSKCFLSFCWKKFHDDLRMITFIKLSILDQ